MAQLPDAGNANYNDERHRLAIFSDDFTVATRTYRGSSIEDLRDTFQRNGFQSSGRNRYAIPCCGDYDGIWVSLTESPNGTTASLSPIDGDLASTWLRFPILSLLVVGLGLGLINSRRSGVPPSSDAPNPGEPALEKATR